MSGTLCAFPIFDRRNIKHRGIEAKRVNSFATRNTDENIMRGSTV